LSCPKIYDYTDASTKIRYFKGGYTPKLYDGHFLKLHQEESEDKFENSVIAGDEHLDNGTKNFRKFRLMFLTKQHLKEDQWQFLTTKAFFVSLILFIIKV